jgi:hypothetical protein
MKKLIMITAGLMVMGLATTSLAHEHDGHDMSEHDMSKHQTKKHAQHMQAPHAHGEMKHGDMQMDNMPKMFLVKKEVDGYEVTFHVMPAKTEMAHGGSHNVMVKIEKDGKEVSDVLINSKVFFPNKTSDSKMLMKMNGWFMNGYDIGEGRHGIMILFKTADGKKHKASVYYPEEK